MSSLLLVGLLFLGKSALAVSVSDYNAIEAHLIAARNATGPQQQKEMMRAIRLALTAYGFLPSNNGLPVMPQGIAQSDGFRDQGLRTWVFTYDPALRNSLMVQDRLRARPVQPGMTADAVTAANGMTVFWVSPNVDPNALAFLVEHELRHFYTFTDPRMPELVAQHEVDIYSWQLQNIGRYGFTPAQESRAIVRCNTEIINNRNEVARESTSLAWAQRKIHAIRRGSAIPVFAEGRTVFVEPEELERIRREAQSLGESVRAEDERRRASALAPAGFAAPQAVADDSALAPAGPTAPVVSFVPEPARGAPSGLNPASLAPLPARDPNYIVAAGIAWSACSGDWNAVAAKLPAYGRLTAADLPLLEGSLAAETNYCRRSMLQRLIDSWRAGRTLDVPSLQNEVQAIRNPPPVYDEPRERPSRREPCTKRGVYYPQCGEDG